MVIYKWFSRNPSWPDFRLFSGKSEVKKQRKFCRVSGTRTKALHTFRGIRSGDCYLTISHKEKASEPYTAPQHMRYSLSPGGNGVIRPTESSPAVKVVQRSVCSTLYPMIGYVTKLVTHLSILQAVLPAETAIILANGKKYRIHMICFSKKNRDFNQKRYTKCKKRDKIKILLERK